MFSICPSIMVPLLVIYPFQNHYITITVLVGHVFFNWPMGINGNGWEYILFGPIGLTHQIQMCQTQTHLHRLIQCMPILQCIYICKYTYIYIFIYLFTNMRWVSSWQGLHVHLCLLCGSLDRRQLQILWNTVDLKNPAPDHR